MSEQRPARRPLVIAGSATAVLVVVTVLAVVGVVLSRLHEISGVRGGHLTVVAIRPVGGLDPARVITPFGISLLSDTLRTPYAFEPGRGVVPDLALGPPQISDDSTQIELTLRPDVRFAPPVDRVVTSDDVAYGLERGFLPSVDSRIATIYFRSIRGAQAFGDGRADTISGLQTPDDDTLLIELKRPVARSVAQALTLTLAAPVPREYAAQYDQRPTSTYGRHLVATGPYQFDSDAGGQLPGPDARSLDLVRNPAWDPETDFRPAFLDSISIVPAADEDRAGEQVLNGHDSVSGDFAASRDLLETGKPKLGDQIRLAQSSATAYVTLNTEAPPLDDVLVRRAVTAAFNPAGARAAVGGAVVGRIPTHWIPPGVPGFEEAGGYAGMGFDFLSDPDGNVALARDYMRQAGYSTGRYDGNASLEAVGVDQPYTRDLAGSVQRAFQSLGIELEVRLMGAKRTDQLCTTRATTPAVCLNGYWLNDFDDAESVLPPLFSGAVIRDRANTNLSLLDDPSANLAMEDANETTGAADRAEAWAEADSAITGLAPAIPIVWYRYPLLRSDDVKGIVDESLAEWDLSFTSLR